MWVKASLQGEYINIDTGASIKANNGTIWYYKDGNGPGKVIFHSDSENPVHDAETRLDELFTEYNNGTGVFLL